MKLQTMILAGILLAFAASARDITVSPGDSLPEARDAARSGDRIVLRGGMYPLSETLVLGPEHSGVTWIAAPGEKPVLSGGVPVTGWTPYTNGIWKAPLNRTEKLRQLYVNGAPARMAQAKGKSFPYRFGMMKDRIPGRGVYGQFEIKGTEPWAIGKGSAPDGIRVDKADLPAVAHPEDLEIRNQPMWTMNRLCIRGMKEEGDHRILLLEQPYGALIGTQGWGSGMEFGNPDPKANVMTANLEVFNALEFVDEPGEFYFDRSIGTLYYMPQAGEKMDTVEVTAPVLETLIAIRGKNLKTHVSQVSFEGLTFAHTGWKLMEIAGGHGACGVQSCALTVKWFHGSSDWHHYKYTNTDLPVAAVEVNSADHVAFTRNTFALTGSMGLKMENDVCDAAIVGNAFRDIGGCSLNIGHPQHVFIGKQNGDNEGHGPYHIDNSLDKWDETIEGLCTTVHIANNLIRRTGLEHPASVGLSVFYGHGITLEHNDLADCPYSGISFGWGWERWDGHPSGNAPGKPSLSLRNNVIRYNKVGPVLQTLRDGGGIYMIGPQVPLAKNPAEQKWMEVYGNHLYGFGGDAVHGMHADNGAQRYYFHDNVFQNIINTVLITLNDYFRKGHNRVENNYANTPLNWGNNRSDTVGLAPDCIITNNIQVENNQWPEAAKQIMEKAGLQAAYRDLFNREASKEIIVSPGDSLAKARDAAKAGDRIILLAGTYRLSEPLTIGPENSAVTWMAFKDEKPVISGGVPVTGWTEGQNGLWKATVNLDNFRQLWVNGRRAQRARGAVPAGLKFWGKYGRTDLVAHDRYWDSMRPERRGKFDAEVKKDPLPDNANGDLTYAPGTLVNIGQAGFTTTDATLAAWGNPGDMEFGFYNTWTHSIAKVEKVTRTGTGATIEMSQPGFFLCCNKGGVQEQSRVPSYMENALELLDEPGEWYFDRPARTLYYLPRAGEDLAKAEVIAPRLESLIEVKGAHDVQFKGLTFAHATWLRPSTSLGHPDVQAGFIQPASNSYYRAEFDFAWVPLNGEQVKSPANVVVDAARGILFDACTFTALGGAGLDLQNGAQSNIVSGCRFFDISGSGIQVGDITRDDHHPRDPNRIVKDNQIINNRISRVGQEYTDSVGVFYGYTEGTIISHNEIFDLPYSGVSGGWGWGMTDAGGGVYGTAVIYKEPTTCKDNRVEFNHIHDTNLLRDDGGCIYMLGRQPGTVIRGNHVHHAVHGHGIYLDEGSADIEVCSNVVYQVHNPLNFNNRNQNRLATCRVHDNYLAPPVMTTTGRTGRALKASSAVDVPYEARFAPTQFTVTAWIRLDRHPDGQDARRWIVCQAPNEFAAGNISLAVDGEKVGGYINIGGGAANWQQAVGGSTPLNQWIPVAMSYDGNTLRGYCSGREVAAKSIGRPFAPSQAAWTLGARSDRFSAFDCGDIDDVRLYSRALTPVELQTLPQDGLVQLWDFEEMTAQDAAAGIVAEAGLDARHQEFLK